MFIYRLSYVVYMSKRATIRFSDKYYEMLKEKAEDLGSSISSIVRIAVNDYFVRNGKQ